MSQPHASIPTPAQGAPVPPLNQGEWVGLGTVHCLCYPACLSVSPTSLLVVISVFVIMHSLCAAISSNPFPRGHRFSGHNIIHSLHAQSPISSSCCSHGPLSSMVHSPVLHGAAMVHSRVLHGAVVHSLSPIRSRRDVPPNVLAPLGPAHQPTPAGGSKCSQPAPRWRGAADATSHHPQRGEISGGGRRGR